MSYELELIQLRRDNVALSARVEELRASLETVHQREMRIAGMLGCGLADLPEHVSALRSALDIASQQRAQIAAALGFDPGEDVFAAVSELGSLRAEVIKRLGFGAEQSFTLALSRYVDNEVERRAGRIDAARLRAVAELSAVRAALRAILDLMGAPLTPTPPA